jgi:hypothetical protein
MESASAKFMPYSQWDSPLESVSQLQINFCAPSSTPHRLGSVDNVSPSLIELFSERGPLSNTRLQNL